MLKIFSHQGKVNQNYNDIPLGMSQPLGWLELKSQVKTTIGEDVNKLEFSYTTGRNVK